MPGELLLNSMSVDQRRDGGDLAVTEVIEHVCDYSGFRG
jgi:imidazole glycerol phosphate synthase subunit HisF